MSGHKTVLCILIAALLLLSACGANAQVTYRLDDAVNEGMLIAPGTEDSARTMDIVPVLRQSMTLNTTFLARPVFPVTQAMRFNTREGTLNLLVEPGQRVSQGDVLARLTMPLDVRLEAEYAAASRRLSRFEEDFELERSELFAELESARQASATPNSITSPRAAVELELLEVMFESFEHRSAMTRDILQNQVDSLNTLRTGEELIAPFDGLVISAVNESAQLWANPVILTIVDCSVFYFQVNIRADGTPLNQYNILGHNNIIPIRSNERHSHDGGHQPLLSFNARVVSDSWAGTEREVFTYLLAPLDREALISELTELAELELLDSEDLPSGLAEPDPIMTMLTYGFTASAMITLAQDTLTLPSRAVFTENLRSFVHIYNDGVLGRRYIHTGVSSNNVVQIISGLEEGTMVVIGR
ncbi:MAG: hypothetical protein FWB75_07315 [Oscillospiraceae bacterium]|nr:hypothetical protein [Oscillospiraceae bacterium]